MRSSGCLTAIGLGFGLALGGGVVYFILTSAELRLALGVTALLTLGIVLGTVGIWLTNRQWTRALNLQFGPGQTTYRVDARPQLPSPYSVGMYPAQGWPGARQLVEPPPLPDMPPMPDYDRQEDDIDPVV